MLPSYHHGGNMPGLGSKPIRKPWVPDLSGTLIAVLVLAVVLALEHFHFQSRLSRVSSLEVSLAKQLHDMQTSMQQQTDQLQRINPRMEEIDSTETSLKRLQEEVIKGKKDLLDAKAAAEDKAALANKQIDNVTTQLTEATARHSRDLEALAKQLESLRDLQTAQVATSAAKDSRISQLEGNVSKLAAKLDSHNSALKTLADQLALHQNSTLSALQQQTVVVSEALEAHRALKDRVESLKLTAATGGTAGSTADEEKVVAAVKKGGALGKEAATDDGLEDKPSEVVNAGQQKGPVESAVVDKAGAVSSTKPTEVPGANTTGSVSSNTTESAATAIDESSTTESGNAADDAVATSAAKTAPAQVLGEVASSPSPASGAGASNGGSVTVEDDHLTMKRSALVMDDGSDFSGETTQDGSSSEKLTEAVASPIANSTAPAQEPSQSTTAANTTAASTAQTDSASDSATAVNQTTSSSTTGVTDSAVSANTTAPAPIPAEAITNATTTTTTISPAKTTQGAVDSATALDTLHALVSTHSPDSNSSAVATDSSSVTDSKDSTPVSSSMSNSTAAELAAESAFKALSQAAVAGGAQSDVQDKEQQDAVEGAGAATHGRHGRVHHLFTKKHLDEQKSEVLKEGVAVLGGGGAGGTAESGADEDVAGLKTGLMAVRRGAGNEEADTAAATQDAAGGRDQGKQDGEHLMDEEEQDVVE